MKTKANTLIEDGQDVKVKNIVTENIFFDDNNSIKIVNDNILIENQDAGVILRGVDGFQLTINEEGVLFTSGIVDMLQVFNNRTLFKVPVILPHYTTALRPSSADEGAVIYDSTLKKCILYNGTAWVNLDGTALA